MANTKKITNALLKLDRLISEIDVCDDESQKHVEQLCEVRDQITNALDE
ncbi:hypothetical protein [Thalassotalea marina]|uniref:Uncharacterized protein n=1 Tax=Thalassotalea marina TaxID=1673741 RepID=A0A919BT45_9GAMM|nr:hypothetical protein [Thalassotalea marina]GHG07916.1 hypothetical protein GCM10017161_42120 [Thalassotalea marina]